MRRDREREPHIHPRAIQVDSLAPARLPLRAAFGSLPSGRPAAWVTGVSIYRAQPENSTISSNFRAISAFRIPKIAPFRKIF
jgi:hypothetical protein